MSDLVGQTLSRYQLASLLGQGGMGAAYRARDLTLKRDVVVKVMHPQFASDPQFQERFLQEAQAAANLDHPSIVKIHDFGQERSLLFMVMELVAGGTLAAHIQADRVLDLRETLALLAQVADALECAHRQGVIHRDVKPSNILLKLLDVPDRPGDPPLRAIVTDFGLAKLAEGGLRTMSGTFMGTLAYMSPEQCLGKPLDGRSDLYSLGVVLYEVVAGKLPLEMQTPTEAVMKHLHEVPPAPSSVRPGVPPAVEAIIQRTLSKQAQDRYATSGEMAGALREAANGLSAGAVANLAQGQPVVSLLTRFRPDETAAPVPPLPRPSPTGLRADRLEIRMEGVPPRHVEIESPAFTIGRNADNAVVLDLPSVSRHHARVEFDGRDYRVTDLGSTNGTFLGGARLLPNLSEPWPPGTPLRLGDCWLHLQRSAQEAEPRPIQPAGTVLAAAEARTATGGARVAVTLDPTVLSVEPGQSVVAHVSVLNQGFIVDHFALCVEGAASAWVSSLPPPLHLMPGEQKGASLVVAPPRSPQSRAGQVPFRVRAASQTQPDQAAVAEGTLTVIPFHQLELDLKPLRCVAVGQGRFRLLARNLGNSDMTLELEGSDPQENCQYGFEPLPALVPAGEEVVLQLVVRPRTYVPEPQPLPHPFSVLVRPAEAPQLAQKVQGEWVQAVPRFEISLSPAAQQEPGRGLFSLQLSNLGDTDLPLGLEASDPEAVCTYACDPAQVTPARGQARSIRLTVQPKPAFEHRARTIAFTARATVPGTPSTQQVQGQWRPKPPRAQPATEGPPPEPARLEPVREAQAPAPVPAARELRPPPPAKRLRWLWRLIALIVLLAGLFLVFVVGMGVGDQMVSRTGRSPALAAAAATWLCGLAITVLLTLWLWRRGR